MKLLANFEASFRSLRFRKLRPVVPSSEANEGVRYRTFFLEGDLVATDTVRVRVLMSHTCYIWGT